MTSESISHEMLLLVEDGPDLSKRLDTFLSSHFQENGKPLYSRTYFQKLIEEGLVKLNGETVKKRELVSSGDEIEIAFPLLEELKLEPEPIPLEILYEDEHILAVNKPANMVVHPAPGNPKGTFANALLYYLGKTPTDDPIRPGIVHRLDKDTTGVLLAAKNPHAHRLLTQQFSSRTVKKRYLAICSGKTEKRTIDLPIGRAPSDRKKMWTDTPRAKQAITIIDPIQFKEPFSFVSCELITGRTHQIRVHLSSIGHPILGDPLYGSTSLNQKHNQMTQLLHAHIVELIHPITGKLISITAPLPPGLSNFLKIHFDL